MKKYELRSAEDMKVMADTGKRSFIDIEYELIVKAIEKAAFDGKYEIELNGTLANENKEKILKAGYTIETSRYPGTADFTTVILWKNPEQNETFIQDDRENSNNYRGWNLTPKGIFRCVLEDMGITKFVSEEQIGKAYETFETLMKAGGYIEEEE